MRRIIASLVVLLFTIVLVNGQPLRKTDWTVLMENATTDGYSYPRVASFKSGNYAIIFGYAAPNNISVTDIRLYTSQTSYKTFETKFSSSVLDTTYVGPMTAHNVVVFPDGTAYGIWQMSGDAVCVGTIFSEAGLVTTSGIYQTSLGRWNATDYLDIAGTNSSHFIIGHSGTTNISNFLIDPLSSSTATPKSFGSRYTVIHSVTGEKLVSGQPVIYTFVVFPTEFSPYPGVYLIQSNSASGVNNYQGASNNTVKAIPFVLSSLDLVAALFVRFDGMIQLLAFDDTSLSLLYQIDLVRNADVNFAPSVLQMGNNVILIAFSTTSNRINYQMVKMSRTTAVLVGPEVTHDAPSTSASVSMASTVGSDIVVVAKDVTGTQILSRTITFCGNGALDLKEECDGSINCNNNCTCLAGTIGGAFMNGMCTDQCNNGIVTGSEECDSGANCTECKCDTGYQPMTPRSQGCQLIPKWFVPNVKPKLDCLDIEDSGLMLYFSFNNLDGYTQTILYGAFNTFFPITFGRDRPSLFPAGQSSTYPDWTYATLVPNDTQSVTWILGSYNLTMDLTDPYAYQCPNSLSVELTVSTLGNLTDALVQKLLQNIADKYNISESRLNATYTLQSTNEQGLNTYVIVVTISPSETSLEQSPTDVVQELLNDLQTSKENLVSELTEGLEEINPVIKSITPSIVETRGRSTTPVAMFTPVFRSDPISQVSAGNQAVFSASSLIIITLIFVFLLSEIKLNL